MEDHLYIVAYDISDAKRWRRIFKILHGYGDWMQLSVFQCRLSKTKRAELESRLREVVKNGQDHLMIIDVGPAKNIMLRIESIGKELNAIEKKAVVI